MNNEVKLNSKMLQWLALAAVVAFGLIMTYVIHETNEAIADIDYYYDQTNQQLVEPPQ